MALLEHLWVLFGSCRLPRLLPLAGNWGESVQNFDEFCPREISSWHFSLTMDSSPGVSFQPPFQGSRSPLRLSPERRPGWPPSATREFSEARMPSGMGEQSMEGGAYRTRERGGRWWGGYEACTPRVEGRRASPSSSSETASILPYEFANSNCHLPFLQYDSVFVGTFWLRRGALTQTEVAQKRALEKCHSKHTIEGLRKLPRQDNRRWGGLIRGVRSQSLWYNLLISLIMWCCQGRI